MRYLLSFILVFVATLTYAQRQNQIVEPWKMWSNLHVYCHVNGTEYSTDYIRFNGDTAIDGENYKKVEYAEDEAHENWSFYGYFIREENNKVFLKRPFEPEGLIYDFTLQNTGDTVTINNPVTSSPLHLTLVETDSVETTGGWRKRRKFVADGYQTPEYWIEGTGSLSGVLNSGMAVFGGLCGSAELLCQHEHDTLVYQNPDYQTCYLLTTGIEKKENKMPGPSVFYNKNSNKVVIKCKNRETRKVVIYNINGNVLESFNMKNNYAAISMPDNVDYLIFVTVAGNHKCTTRKLLVY
jgi:hypothetical protein